VSTLSDDILVSLSIALLDRCCTQFRHGFRITTPLNEVARLGLVIRIYKNAEQIKAADRLASFALHSGHRSLDYLLKLRVSRWLWILDGLMKSRLINDQFRQFGPQLIDSDSVLFQVRGEAFEFTRLRKRAKPPVVGRVQRRLGSSTLGMAVLNERARIRELRPDGDAAAKRNAALSRCRCPTMRAGRPQAHLRTLPL
jgi:hypothetical protein